MATHAHTASGTAPEADEMAHHPAISIVDLARRHRALYEYYEAVKRAGMGLRVAHGKLSPAPMPAGREGAVIRRRDLEAGEDRVEDELRALVDLILATQPITIQDAAAQLPVAVDRAENIMDGGDDENRQQRWKSARGALVGSMKVVVREAGLSLAAQEA